MMIAHTLFMVSMITIAVTDDVSPDGISSVRRNSPWPVGAHGAVHGNLWALYVGSGMVLGGGGANNRIS